MFGWLKRRREERAHRQAMESRRREYQQRAYGAPSASASLPGDSIDALSPPHPLSPIYGGHAVPDTSVSHGHGGSCASGGGSSSSSFSDAGSSGGGCD